VIDTEGNEVLLIVINQWMETDADIETRRHTASLMDPAVTGYTSLNVRVMVLVHSTSSVVELDCKER